MIEFVFSIGQIFQKDECLKSGQCYYIPPYQRGYKWASESRYDQVPQLLIDTYTAFLSGMDCYYLQYITVKYDRKNNWHEVIDGQQRLTTLSLLFYLRPEEKNIAKNKVRYARYSKGGAQDIMEVVVQYIAETEETSDRTLDKQDFYYLAKAARCIKRFFDICKENDTLDEYIQYLIEHVKIILNSENEFTNSEETFLNLNGNKVALTNTYLIKGLLLTLAVRRENHNHTEYGYKEILDQRVIMGRQWDEISAWMSSPDVSYYFFKRKDNGMEALLEFVINSLGMENNTSKYQEDGVLSAFISGFDTGTTLKHDTPLALFNEYNEVIHNYEDAFSVLQRIKHTYHKLRGIYDNHSDSSLFNLLGYAMFRETTSGNEFHLADIIDKSERQIRSLLSDLALASMPKLEDRDDNKDNTERYKELQYRSYNPELKNLLLSFSVFPEVEDSHYRFDFCSYHRQKWSFEHISPQRPKSEVRIDDSAKDNVVRMLEKKIADIKRQGESGGSDKETAEKELETLVEAIQCVKDGKKVKADTISFLYDESISMDSLGNMALLTGGVNSALNNNPYMAKRSILFAKQKQGYFIPRHTMDVFNKALNTKTQKSFTPDLFTWNDDDIKAHIAWMEKRNTAIRTELENTVKDDHRDEIRTV